MRVLSLFGTVLAVLPLQCAIAMRQNPVAEWQGVAVKAISNSRLSAPAAARALAITATCMYDAWAAYDDHAVGTQLRGALRRPADERTPFNKQQAMSYAAYRALVDLLPSDAESMYKPLMRRLGYDPGNRSTDIETPIGIANVSCLAVLEFRHHDQSNQLADMPSNGTEPMGPYEDWTGYHPVNPPGTVPIKFATGMSVNADHWQPLTYTDSRGGLMLQRFAGAQWCYVVPFAMSKGDEFRSAIEPGPLKYGSRGYLEQVNELVDISANLTDRQKMIAEYWADGPNTAQPPGHWTQFAQVVSERDHHSIDEDVKMFFVLSNAMLDAGIAAWDAKRAYDSVRPITAVDFLLGGKRIRAWGGPGKGTVEMEMGRNGYRINGRPFPRLRSRIMFLGIARLVRRPPAFLHFGLGWIISVIRLRWRLEVPGLSPVRPPPNLWSCRGRPLRRRQTKRGILGGLVESTLRERIWLVASWDGWLRTEHGRRRKPTLMVPIARRCSES